MNPNRSFSGFRDDIPYVIKAEPLRQPLAKTFPQQVQQRQQRQACDKDRGHYKIVKEVSHHPLRLVQSLQLSGRFIFQKLETVEPAVGSFKAEEFLVSSFLGDLSVHEHHDAIGFAYG